MDLLEVFLDQLHQAIELPQTVGSFDRRTFFIGQRPMFRGLDCFTVTVSIFGHSHSRGVLRHLSYQVQQVVRRPGLPFRE